MKVGFHKVGLFEVNSNSAQNFKKYFIWIWGKSAMYKNTRQQTQTYKLHGKWLYKYTFTKISFHLPMPRYEATFIWLASSSQDMTFLIGIGLSQLDFAPIGSQYSWGTEAITKTTTAVTSLFIHLVDLQPRTTGLSLEFNPT